MTPTPADKPTEETLWTDAAIERLLFAVRLNRWPDRVLRKLSRLPASWLTDWALLSVMWIGCRMVGHAAQDRDCARCFRRIR